MTSTVLRTRIEGRLSNLIVHVEVNDRANALTKAVKEIRGN